MRPRIDRSSELAPLPPFRSWLDCTINTSGCDFRKGQGFPGTVTVTFWLGTDGPYSIRLLDKLSYRRHRFPSIVIQQAVWLYFRFALSYRDVEDMLAERGIDVSYETVRRSACLYRKPKPGRSDGEARQGWRVS